jgi:hypothetical protein
MTLNENGVTIKISPVSILALVLDLDNERSSFAAFLDKVLQTATTVSGAGFATETESYGRQDSALATAVFADDKVEEWTKVAV